jgi:hypothetical protein
VKTLHEDVAFGIAVFLLCIGIGGCNYLSRDPAPVQCPCIEKKEAK